MLNDVVTDSKATNPSSSQEGLQQVLENFNNSGSADDTGDDDPEDPQLVKDAKKRSIEQSTYTWTERDCMLYNLGIGATEKELQYTFEGDENFQVSIFYLKILVPCLIVTWCRFYLRLASSHLSHPRVFLVSSRVKML